MYCVSIRWKESWRSSTHCSKDVSAATGCVRASVDSEGGSGGISSPGVSEQRMMEAKLVCNILVLYVSDGSAIFKGCFHKPDNVTLALPFSAIIQNMSVDKCVDMCTERVRTRVYSCIVFYVQASVCSVCDGGCIFFLGEIFSRAGWRSVSLRLPNSSFLSSWARERGHVSPPLPGGRVWELWKWRVLCGLPDAGSR